MLHGPNFYDTRQVSKSGWCVISKEAAVMFFFFWEKCIDGSFMFMCCQLEDKTQGFMDRGDIKSTLENILLSEMNLEILILKWH